ncbi:MAG TPA: glycosyltransferase, partial [Azospirillaceae bacterium]|nr:glycosyltransferase [Azospirillaceae bacterium]
MRVAAVIVTYNRLPLLQTCVAAVRQQTRPADRIIVVDNASTDGTSEWLSSQRDLTVVTQPNSGSAGAYHSGIAAALASDDDWIWCMDDDGVPEVKALEELERQATRHDLAMAGPLVVTLDDPTELSFGLHGRRRVAEVVRMAPG